MESGRVVASRFRIQARAGAGGMGVVYQALDESTGMPVALKVLHPDQRPERFLREARVLSEIHHPAVVRYVDHGITSDGRVYLAMEWLPGRPLSRLLAERRLSFAECLALLRRLCSGLAVAHDRGVVHRDLKPGNVLLPDDTVETAKLIDFGIARRRFDSRLTERGLLIGTLAYMSPEQACGAHEVGPSSDVFSLGAMIYKCLAGTTPFGGGDATALLARVLLEDPPLLGSLVEGIPAPFEDLVARMLSKDRGSRLPDARSLLDALERLSESVGAPSGPRRGIGRREQRVVWLVLLGGLPPEDTETREARLSKLGGDPEARLTAEILGRGGRYHMLADGTRVASFAGAGAAQDEAERAVRIAELMRQVLPGRAIAVASGQGVMAGSAPLGEAIDRGVALLGAARAGEIRVDDITTRLLAGQGASAEPLRHLLGRPTTCVGRDVELSTLEALLDECVRDSVARAAIVLGPAGVGKSRLRDELVLRARARFENLTVLVGRADSVGAGSPFSPLRQALRRAAEIQDGEEATSSRSKLESYVDRVVAHPQRRAGLAAYLGELAGVTFPDSSHETLAATRQSPTLLGDAMRSAWIDFLAGSVAAGPTLLVLEDLHWGDLPTASFVDAALSSLSEKPLFVLGLGRPELVDALPGLWQKREPQLLRLAPLRRASASALAREVLGSGSSKATIERLVELSEGNAFFLEELLRAVSEGRDELPESVLAMVQARLESLDTETRRVLRAGSVYGSSFRPGGALAVLGGDLDQHYVSRELADLAQREWLTLRPTSDIEYVFRQTLVQETVYATLTAEDRRLGHRLAAEWLEQAGGADAAVLAEHYHRAGLPDRALRFYLRAAEQALEGGDFAATLDRVERARASEPDDLTRGELGYLAAEARYWRGEYQESDREARAAVELLPAGSARCFLATGALFRAAGTLGKYQDVALRAAKVADVVPENEEARAAQVICLIRACGGQLKRGDYTAADELIRKADESSSRLGKLGMVGAAWVHYGRSGHAFHTGDVATFIREIGACIVGFEQVGEWRTAANARVNLGYAMLSVGDLERAECLLREAVSSCERLGMAGIAGYAVHNLGLVLGLRGAFEEGARLERRAIAEADGSGESLLSVTSRLYLSLILGLAGDPVGAEQQARAARSAARTVPAYEADCLAAESAALLAQGRAPEALGPARAAIELLEERGGSDETDGRVRCALAEALLASNLLDEARAEVLIAAKKLEERAARLGDEHLARCFRERVPEHARLLALAERMRT